MKRCAWIGGLLAAAALFSGCIVTSESPLYLPEDPASLAGLGLLGPWSTADTENLAYVQFAEEQRESGIRAYLELADGKGGRAYFDCHPCQIGEALVLDLNMMSPEVWTALWDDPNAQPAAEVLRVFAKVTKPGADQLALAPLDPNKLFEYLKAHPDELEHQATFEKGALSALHLTAPTADLRAFLSRHLAADLFAEPLVLVRSADNYAPGDPDSGLASTG